MAGKRQPGDARLVDTAAPAARGPRRRNPRGHGGRLREEILTRATELIARLGDAEALTIRAVTADVGITAPSVYRHYADKAALLRAVVEAGFAAFTARLELAQEGRTDPFDILRSRSMAYLDFARDEPGLYRVLFSATSLGPGPLGLDDGPHPGAASFDALVASIQRCLDARADDGRDAFVVAVSFWSWLHGIADLRIGKPEFPWPDPNPMLDDTLARFDLVGPAPRNRGDL